MASRPTFTVTCAVAGSGKTYIRGARFVADEFLPERTGVHYSNFPLKVAEMCEFASKKTGKPVEEFVNRVYLIPGEEIQRWAREESGPWEFFRDVDIQDAHIAIDEAHNVCGDKHSANHRRKWSQWLGELRHRGACCEFISQDEGKLAREVVKEAAQRIALVNSETRRDPYFGITLGEWYELRAGFLTGEYEAAVWEVEQRRVMSKWVVERERKFRFEQRFFDLYDSYNTPHGGGVKATNPPHEYMRRTKRQLLLWFAKRNAWPLISRPLIVALFAWVSLGGGWLVGMEAFKDLVKGFMKSKPEAAAVDGAPASPAPSATGQPTLADPVEVATRLRKELTDAEAAVASFKARAETAEALARKYGAELGAGYRLTLINNEVCTFKNGVSYRVGEVIEDGPYKGERVELLDWPRRRVVLASGQFLQLGAEPVIDLSGLEQLPPIVAPQPGFAPRELPKPRDWSGVAPVPLDPDRMQRAVQAGARADEGGGVPRTLSEDELRVIHAAAVERQRLQGHVISQPNAPSGVLPMGEQRSPGFYSSGTGPRR